MNNYYETEFVPSCGVGNHGRLLPNGLCVKCRHNPNKELERVIPRSEGKHRRE